MGPPEPRLEDEHEGRGASGLSHMGADSEMGKADYTLIASRGSLGPPHQPMRWALAQQENANICNLLGVEKETEVPLSENAGPWGQTVGTEPGLAAWSLRLRRPSRAIGNGPQPSANNQDDPRAPLEAGAVPLLPFAAAHCWCCGKAQDQDALAARPCTSSQALRGCFEMAWMELGLLGGEIRERHSPQSGSLPSKDTAAGQGASWQGSELFAELFATKAKPSPFCLGRPTQRSLHLRSKPLLMAKVRKDDPQEGTTLESA